MTTPAGRTPRRRLEGRVAGLFRTGTTGFETVSIESLQLDFEGIAGDRHAGATRRTGGREPWYPRGTVIRNERQLSVLCPQELASTADALEIGEIRPEWVGGNILLDGVTRLSWLPARTVLRFAGGAVVKIDGDNAPCRQSGRAVAERFPDRPGVEAAYVRAARHRRGLIGWVERPGAVRLGEGVEVCVPEQWIYEG